MGNFVIYSIGDAAFLEQILIAVSMLTGTGDFERMVGIGLLLGVLMIAVQSIFQGARQINWQQVFIGFLLYMLMFGPSALVKIEDVYSGHVRVVANVPIGVAAPGAMFSNVGYGITRLFELSYSVISPGLTNSSYAESLKLLNEIRRRANDPGLFMALNEALGGGYVDFRRSWHNYIRECTLTKIDLGDSAGDQKMSIDEIMTKPVTEALRFTSSLYGTRLYLEPGNSSGRDLTCTDAWGQLEGAMTAINDPRVATALMRLVSSSSGGAGGMGPGGLPVTDFSKVNGALHALGQTMTQAQSYLQLAVLEPLYYEAAQGRYQDQLDFSSAMMINQALQQRNTQWAAEQSMFMTVVRPMLTFFEGFVYAITPFAAFIIVMGSFGMQLAGKYLQTILWIQLWMPVLSITNLFIHMSASGEITARHASQLESFYALSSSSEVLQHWIATGGMLAAATPIISLFIVTGSSYAMTSIAQKVGGGDFVDEKVQSPDIVRQGALMDNKAAYAHNAMSGSLVSGAEGLISTLSLGSQLGSSVSSARALQSQSAQAFQNTLGRGFSDDVSHEQAYSRLSSLGRLIGSQNTEQSKLVNEQAKRFMDQFKIDDSHADVVRGLLAAQATGTLDVDQAASMLLPMVGKARAGLKAAAGVKPSGTALVPAKGGKGGDDLLDTKAQALGATESSATDTSIWSASDISQYLKNVQFGSENTQALTNQLARGFANQNNETFKSTWGDTLSQNLTQTAQKLVSASDTFTQMSQLQQQMGSMTNADFKTLGGVVAQNAAAMNQLNDYFTYAAPEAVKNEARELESRYRSYGMSAPVAQAAARLTAMTNAGNYEPGKQVDGFRAALGAINLATGRNFGSDANPHQNSGFKPPAVGDPESLVRAEVGSGPRRLDRNEIRRASGTNPANDPERPLPASDQQIADDHSLQLQQLRERAEGTNRRISAPEEQKARNNLLNALPEQSWSASAWGAWDNATDWLERRGEQALGSLVTGSKAAANDFSRAMDDLRNMTPEQREKFIAATKAGDQAIKDEFGWAGGLVVGTAKLGRFLIGAAATGYSKAKEWLGGGTDLSEAAKGMSLEERGAFYAAAFASASEAGSEAAAQFMQQYGDEFKATMRSIAQSRYNLTPAQAAVFAESFDTDKDRMDQAINGLKMEYAERNPDGSVMMDANGRPVLSEANEQFTDRLVNVLQNATKAGDRAGSYLTAVRGYNIANRGF